jgi:23S rRNA pseudouridine2457 synthase
MHHYFTIYKPYLVLSQFSKEGNHQTLKDFFDVPTDVYPVGRLDADSEGLLLLTNDVSMNHRVLHPTNRIPKTYWVQVDGDISSAAINALETGVVINHQGKAYHTKPARVHRFTEAPIVAPRVPPIRFRASIPAPWIELTIWEGKNRQIRKMTASVGFPTLRLIRYRLGNLTLDGMNPGDMRSWSKSALLKALF